MQGTHPGNLFYRLMLLAMLAAVVTACGIDRSHVRKSVPEGDPDAGRQAALDYGCGSCHTIQGVPGANGLVGPPLVDFGRRHIIAGVLPNTSENLVQWIQHPQAIRPGSVMPDLNVSASDARNIAAYLYGQ